MKIRDYIKKHKILIALIIFIVSLSIFMMIFSGSDSDYYWHIKAGEKMLASKKILTTDIFSWYMIGKNWFSHEWLFEIIIAIIANIFPNKHIFIYVLSNLLFLNLFLLFTNKSNYQKNIAFSLIWITFSLILTTTLRARPYMLSNIFLAIIMYILYDLMNNENSKKIYFIPIISLLWSNVHGGSSNLVYIIPLLFLISGLFSFCFSKVESTRVTKIQIKKLLITIALSIFAIVINPQGIKMLFYPYQNITDTYMQQTIAEWQPTTLANLWHYPYFILVGLIVISFLFSKKKIRLLDLIIFIFFLFLGLKSIRFWSYIYISASYYIFNYISKRENDQKTVSMIIMISIIFLLVYSTVSTKLESKDYNLNNKVINLLKKENPLRLYNSYDYGGYLIYNNIKVFIDGRADLYSNYNYKDYYSISNLDSSAEKMITKYKFDYFLVKKEYPIATYLKINKNYTNIYHDKNLVIYKKNTE